MAQKPARQQPPPVFSSDGRRVTVAYHGHNTTFVPKTLKSMIEEQARWTEEDLRRLKLIR